MLGLFFNNELIFVMSFSKSKTKNNINDYDLIRCCKKLNLKITDCEKILLDYFSRTYSPKTITTYVNRSYNDSEMFSKLGFNVINISKPRYYYVVGSLRIPNTLYKTYCNEKKHYNKIYDSGNIKMKIKY